MALYGATCHAGRRRVLGAVGLGEGARLLLLSQHHLATTPVAAAPETRHHDEDDDEPEMETINKYNQGSHKKLKNMKEFF